MGCFPVLPFGFDWCDKVFSFRDLGRGRVLALSHTSKRTRRNVALAGGNALAPSVLREPLAGSHWQATTSSFFYRSRSRCAPLFRIGETGVSHGLSRHR